MTGLVLLASYPKSGNTWLRAVLESVRQGGDTVPLDRLGHAIPNAAGRVLFDTAMGVDSSDLSQAEIARARPYLYRHLARHRAEGTFLKVHDALLPCQPDGELLFPADAVDAVVYVVRDPRDVAVSLAHHNVRTVDETIANMADEAGTLARAGKVLSRQLPQLLSSWSAHVESWLDAPALRRHVMRYEEMVAAPEAAFGAVLRFLGLETTPNVLAGALAATRFDALRAQEDRDGFSERPAGMHRFFRRGVAGGWRDSLTAAQAERIARDHQRVMRRLGYLP